MKKIISFIPALSLLLSLNGQSGELTKQEACNTLSTDKVAMLLLAESKDITQEDMSFGSSKKRSICQYYINGRNASVQISLSWKSEKAITNRVLEKTYSKYLANGEKDIKSYEQVASSEDHQTLYGVQKSRSGFVHIIRKRIQNSAEVKIEVQTDKEDASLKSKLLSAVDEIN